MKLTDCLYDRHMVYSAQPGLSARVNFVAIAKTLIKGGRYSEEIGLL